MIAVERLRFIPFCLIALLLSHSACGNSDDDPLALLSKGEADHVMMLSRSFNGDNTVSTLDLPSGEVVSDPLRQRFAPHSQITRTPKHAVILEQRRNGDSVIYLRPLETRQSTQRELNLNDALLTNALLKPTQLISLNENKAYLICNGIPRILILDFGQPTQRMVLGSIDLSSFRRLDNRQSIVKPSMGVLHRDRLFVSIGRFSITPDGLPSYPLRATVAVIDTRTNSLIDTNATQPGMQGIELQGINPFGNFIVNPQSQRLWLSHVGIRGKYDGGIEVINPETFRSEGWIVRERLLGGDFGHNGFALGDANQLWTLTNNRNQMGVLQLSPINSPSPQPRESNVHGMHITSPAIFTWTEQSYPYQGGLNIYTPDGRELHFRSQKPEMLTHIQDLVAF